MDIDVTQKLIKESIICLCRNHFCLESSEDIKFEIDGIICVSFDDKRSDKHTVFKIHEWITSNKNSRRNGSYEDPVSNTITQNTLDSASISVHFIDSIVQQTQNMENFPDPAKLSTFNGSCLTPVSSRKRKSSSPRHQSQLKVISSSLPYNVESIDNFDIHNELVDSEDDEPRNKIIISQTSIKNERDCFKIEDSRRAKLLKTEKTVLTSVSNLLENEDEVNTDNLAFSCAHCDVVCITCNGIKDHFKDSHGTSHSWTCMQCRIGFSSEEGYSNHCRLQGCEYKNSDITCDSMGAMIDTLLRNDSNENFLDEGHKFMFDEENLSSQITEDNCPGADKPGTSLQDISNVDFNSDSCSNDFPSIHEGFRSCSICGEEFKDFPLFNVHLTEAHSLYPCPYCEKTYSDQSERDMHLFDHTGESPLDCPVCDTNFRNVELLEEHKLTCHSDTLMRAPESSTLNTLNHKVNRTLCKTAANNTDSSTKAAGSSGNKSSNLFFITPTIEISDEDEELGSDSLNGGPVAPPDPFMTFKCDVCGEVMTGIEAYSDHCALAHRRIPCPYCGGTFSQKASMERHQRLHTGIKPFRCTLCPLSFTRKEPLRTHLSRTHKINDFYIL